MSVKNGAVFLCLCSKIRTKTRWTKGSEFSVPLSVKPGQLLKIPADSGMRQIWDRQARSFVSLTWFIIFHKTPLNMKVSIQNVQFHVVWKSLIRYLSYSFSLRPITYNIILNSGSKTLINWYYKDNRVNPTPISPFSQLFLILNVNHMHTDSLSWIFVAYPVRHVPWLSQIYRNKYSGVGTMLI